MEGHHGMAIPEKPEAVSKMKKNNYDPNKALGVLLTAYEQEIEDAIDETAQPEYSDAVTVNVFSQAARETLREMRGGARLGAGRKPRPHVRTTVLLAPAIRRKLERLAKKKGSLSATVESLIESA